MPDVETTLESLSIATQPRRWQEEALAAWIANSRSGIVEVATGAGKTVFAELCMAAASGLRPDLRFIVVIPTQALLDQWFVSLQEDFRLPSTEIGAWSGRGIPGTPPRFNLMVINTARWAVPHLSAQFSTMLVVDEVHRAGSPANAAALSGDHLATLGMSATPERDYDDAFAELIVPALGPIIYRYTLDDAAGDHLLSPFQLINVEVDLQPYEREEYDQLTRRIGRASAKRSRDDDASAIGGPVETLLRRRARISALAAMRIPVAVRLVEEHRGARMVIFHEEIASAEAIYRVLQQRGHSVTIYHSKVGDALRRDNLRLFRRGVFDVLVACRALDEGINIPEVQIAVIAAASATTRQRIQRLGRVLRPAPRKDSALVYTLFATAVEEARLRAEAKRLASAESITWLRSRLDKSPRETA